jgi:hypothetical protein
MNPKAKNNIWYINKMQFSSYEYDTYVKPPEPKLNGGLYTGEPFAKDAPWANVPVIADIDYMTHYNLRSANPPIEALFQYPGTVRPGNNFQNMTGLAKPSGYDFLCTPCLKNNGCYTTDGKVVCDKQ